MAQTFTTSIEGTKYVLENSQASMDECVADVATLGPKWSGTVGFAWIPNNINDASQGHVLSWFVTLLNADQPYVGLRGEPGNTVVVYAGNVYIYKTAAELAASEFA